MTIWPVSVSVRYDPGSVSVDDLSAFSDLRDRRIELTDDDWLAHALYWIDAATAEEASDLAAARFSEEAQAQGLSAQPSTVSVQVHGEEGLNLLK